VAWAEDRVAGGPLPGDPELPGVYLFGLIGMLNQALITSATFRAAIAGHFDTSIRRRVTVSHQAAFYSGSHYED
jgi:hypothetical protein